MVSNKLAQETLKYFADFYSGRPSFISIAPGRVNIIGEHTDYNDGLAMPSAIDRHVCVAISKNKNQLINAYSTALGKTFSYNLGSNIADKLWHKYVLGVVNELDIKYNINSGLDILIHSNLDIGGGVSSSAALELALINAILHLFEIEASSSEKIDLCQRVEHNHIHIKSGTLDQSASLLSREGYLLVLDFQDNEYRYIKNNSENITWVLVDSMIKRKLANSKYHERVLECRHAIRSLKSTYKDIHDFNNVDNSQLDSLMNIDETGYKRAKHIISENIRVHKMEEAIINQNIIEMGNILIDSHISLRDFYQVSCDEIDYLIDISSDFKDWYGGRIMGGGFGGNTINLIKENMENDYSNFIKKKYLEKFQIMPKIRTVNFSSGAKIIDNIKAF